MAIIYFQWALLAKFPRTSTAVCTARPCVQISRRGAKAVVPVLEYNTAVPAASKPAGSDPPASGAATSLYP